MDSGETFVTPKVHRARRARVGLPRSRRLATDVPIDAGPGPAPTWVRPTSTSSSVRMVARRAVPNPGPPRSANFVEEFLC